MPQLQLHHMLDRQTVELFVGLAVVSFLISVYVGFQCTSPLALCYRPVEDFLPRRGYVSFMSKASAAPTATPTQGTGLPHSLLEVAPFRARCLFSMITSSNVFCLMLFAIVLLSSRTFSHRSETALMSNSTNSTASIIRRGIYCMRTNRYMCLVIGTICVATVPVYLSAPFVAPQFVSALTLSQFFVVACFTGVPLAVLYTLVLLIGVRDLVLTFLLAPSTCSLSHTVINVGYILVTSICCMRLHRVLYCFATTFMLAEQLPTHVLTVLNDPDLQHLDTVPGCQCRKLPSLDENAADALTVHEECKQSRSPPDLFARRLTEEQQLGPAKRLSHVEKLRAEALVALRGYIGAGIFSGSAFRLNISLEDPCGKLSLPSPFLLAPLAPSRLKGPSSLSASQRCTNLLNYYSRQLKSGHDIGSACSPILSRRHHKISTPTSSSPGSDLSAFSRSTYSSAIEDSIRRSLYRETVLPGRSGQTCCCHQFVWAHRELWDILQTELMRFWTRDQECAGNRRGCRNFSNPEAVSSRESGPDMHGVQDSDVLLTNEEIRSRQQVSQEGQAATPNASKGSIICKQWSPTVVAGFRGNQSLKYDAAACRLPRTPACDCAKRQNVGGEGMDEASGWPEPCHFKSTYRQRESQPALAGRHKRTTSSLPRVRRTSPRRRIYLRRIKLCPSGCRTRTPTLCRRKWRETRHRREIAHRTRRHTSTRACKGRNGGVGPELGVERRPYTVQGHFVRSSLPGAPAFQRREKCDQYGSTRSELASPDMPSSHTHRRPKRCRMRVTVRCGRFLPNSRMKKRPFPRLLVRDQRKDNLHLPQPATHLSGTGANNAEARYSPDQVQSTANFYAPSSSLPSSLHSPFPPQNEKRHNSCVGACLRVWRLLLNVPKHAFRRWRRHDLVFAAATFTKGDQIDMPAQSWAFRTFLDEDTERRFQRWRAALMHVRWRHSIPWQILWSMLNLALISCSYAHLYADHSGPSWQTSSAQSHAVGRSLPPDTSGSTKAVSHQVSHFLWLRILLQLLSETPALLMLMFGSRKTLASDGKGNAHSESKTTPPPAARRNVDSSRTRPYSLMRVSVSRLQTAAVSWPVFSNKVKDAATTAARAKAAVSAQCTAGIQSKTLQGTPPFKETETMKHAHDKLRWSSLFLCNWRLFVSCLDSLWILSAWYTPQRIRVTESADVAASPPDIVAYGAWLLNAAQVPLNPQLLLSQQQQLLLACSQFSLLNAVFAGVFFYRLRMHRAAGGGRLLLYSLGSTQSFFWWDAPAQNVGLNPTATSSDKYESRGLQNEKVYAGAPFADSIKGFSRSNGAQEAAAILGLWMRCLICSVTLFIFLYIFFCRAFEICGRRVFVLTALPYYRRVQKNLQHSSDEEVRSHSSLPQQQRQRKEENRKDSTVPQEPTLCERQAEQTTLQLRNQEAVMFQAASQHRHSPQWPQQLRETPQPGGTGLHQGVLPQSEDFQRNRFSSWCKNSAACLRKARTLSHPPREPRPSCLQRFCRSNGTHFTNGAPPVISAASHSSVALPPCGHAASPCSLPSSPPSHASPSSLAAFKPCSLTANFPTPSHAHPFHQQTFLSDETPHVPVPHNNLTGTELRCNSLKGTGSAAAGDVAAAGTAADNSHPSATALNALSALSLSFRSRSSSLGPVCALHSADASHPGILHSVRDWIFSSRTSPPSPEPLLPLFSVAVANHRGRAIRHASSVWEMSPARPRALSLSRRRRPLLARRAVSLETVADDVTCTRASPPKPHTASHLFEQATASQNSSSTPLHKRLSLSVDDVTRVLPLAIMVAGSSSTVTRALGLDLCSAQGASRSLANNNAQSRSQQALAHIQHPLTRDILRAHLVEEGVHSPALRKRVDEGAAVERSVAPSPCVKPTGNGVSGVAAGGSVGIHGTCPCAPPAAVHAVRDAATVCRANLGASPDAAVPAVGKSLQKQSIAPHRRPLKTEGWAAAVADAVLRPRSRRAPAAADHELPTGNVQGHAPALTVVRPENSEETSSTVQQQTVGLAEFKHIDIQEKNLLQHQQYPQSETSPTTKSGRGTPRQLKQFQGREDVGTRGRIAATAEGITRVDSVADQRRGKLLLDEEVARSAVLPWSRKTESEAQVSRAQGVPAVAWPLSCTRWGGWTLPSNLNHSIVAAKDSRHPALPIHPTGKQERGLSRGVAHTEEKISENSSPRVDSLAESTRLGNGTVRYSAAPAAAAAAFEGLAHTEVSAAAKRQLQEVNPNLSTNSGYSSRDCASQPLSADYGSPMPIVMVSTDTETITSCPHTTAAALPLEWGSSPSDASARQFQQQGGVRSQQQFGLHLQQNNSTRPLEYTALQKIHQQERATPRQDVPLHQSGALWDRTPCSNFDGSTTRYCEAFQESRCRDVTVHRSSPISTTASPFGSAATATPFVRRSPVAAADASQPSTNALHSTLLGRTSAMSSPLPPPYSPPCPNRRHWSPTYDLTHLPRVAESVRLTAFNLPAGVPDKKAVTAGVARPAGSAFRRGGPHAASYTAAPYTAARSSRTPPSLGAGNAAEECGFAGFVGRRASVQTCGASPLCDSEPVVADAALRACGSGACWPAGGPAAMNSHSEQAPGGIRRTSSAEAFPSAPAAGVVGGSFSAGQTGKPAGDSYDGVGARALKQRSKWVLSLMGLAARRGRCSAGTGTKFSHMPFCNYQNNNYCHVTGVRRNGSSTVSRRHTSCTAKRARASICRSRRLPSDRAMMRRGKCFCCCNRTIRSHSRPQASSRRASRHTRCSGARRHRIIRRRTRDTEKRQLLASCRAGRGSLRKCRGNAELQAHPESAWNVPRTVKRQTRLHLTTSAAALALIEALAETRNSGEEGGSSDGQAGDDDWGSDSSRGESIGDIRSGMCIGGKLRCNCILSRSDYSSNDFIAGSQDWLHNDCTNKVMYSRSSRGGRSHRYTHGYRQSSKRLSRWEGDRRFLNQSCLHPNTVGNPFAKNAVGNVTLRRFFDNRKRNYQPQLNTCVSDFGRANSPAREGRFAKRKRRWAGCTIRSSSSEACKDWGSISSDGSSWSENSIDHEASTTELDKPYSGGRGRQNNGCEKGRSDSSGSDKLYCRTTYNTGAGWGAGQERGNSIQSDISNVISESY